MNRNRPTPTLPDEPPDALDRLADACPSTWFAALENALASGDFEAALDADRHLRQLGVRVRFPAIRATDEAEASRHE